ncbi:MAG: type II secretion system F family protein [Acidobacteria bacterium]|nr:type II secretion system F family protein [Acidobacteriota bacterium]
MPTYTFKGRNLRTGVQVAGQRFAVNKQTLAGLLRKEQIALTSITEKGKEFALPRLRQGVKDKEVAIFTRQFSVMLDAGLPIVQCLEIIANQQENKTFQTVLLHIRDDVETGMTLSDAMAKHPKVFDQLFSSMIAAGEAGGILDTILQRLTTFIEKLVKLKRALKSAMIYPVAVLSVAVIVVFIILWKAIPIFATLFQGLGADLPAPTRFVIFLSNFIEDYVLFIFAAVFLFFMGIRSYYRTNSGRRVLDALLLKVPLLGEIFTKIGTARFSRTLSTLITSGVPILEGLEITAKTAGNVIIQEAILKTRRSIEEGKTLSEPMKQTNIFGPMVTQMIAVGEQTGELDTMLSKVADYYEEEVDTVVENLMTIMEPLLLVILGAIVGGIVISMYLPMFSLINKMGGG